MSSEQTATRTISRRTVVGAAVWATPVVAVVAATPAHAAASPVLTDPGSIKISCIDYRKGHCGKPACGSFTVQARRGVVGDTRTVVLTATVTIEQWVNGKWVSVGKMTPSPGSHSVRLDGGRGQFTFCGGPALKKGTYRIRVDAQGLQSDGSVLVDTSYSQSFYA